MAFTATVCQVYVSGSVGTEVVVVVQTLIGHYDFEGLCLPVNPLWVKKGNANRLD